MSVHREIEQKVSAFTAELTTLLRKASLEAVEQALGRGAGAAPSASTARATGRAVGAPAAKPRLPRARKGQKRDPEDLDRIVLAVRDHIAANPGHRMEHISKHLGIASSELKLPIAKLLDQKAIKTKGQRRGTQYFAVG